jgi:phosphoglycerate dehydrogenase-like enzyme
MRKILVQIPRNQAEQFFSPETLSELQKLGEVEWNPFDRAYSGEELKDRIKGVHTVITTWRTAPISDDVLKEADQLKVIAHMAGSLKPVLPSAAEVYRRGIKVLNSNYAIGVSVSESVLALILALGHKIVQVDNAMRSGVKWKDSSMETYELRGKTVGVVGLGMVAREVIKLLQPFGVNILACDPFVSEDRARELGVRMESLHSLIAQADILSLHAPKIPETFHMIGRKELGLIKDGALLINTARGDLIEEEALIEELRKKRFKAGLDVFVVEPLAVDHELRTMDNVIARPHLAGVNPDSRRRIGKLMVEDMKRLYNGERVLFEVKEEQLTIMT